MADAKRDSIHLTVALIVRNAAVPLKATLTSVRGLADEIVVLDTGSTDDTLRLAAEHRAAVHRSSWNDNFSEARNACLQHCRGDWVLWLDAGEQLSAAAAGELRQFVAQQTTQSQAFLLPVLVAPDEQVQQIRLHPRQGTVRFAGRVRESLDASLAAAGISVQPLPIAIQRDLAANDPLVKCTKAQRNIRLADRALAESGPAASMHNCLGEALQMLGDPLRAARQYQRAVKLAAPASRDQLEGYYGLLTCLEGTGPDRSAQLTLCMEALDRFPLDAQLLVALGGYLQSQGQPALAIRAYDVAFRHGQIEPRIAHLSEIQQIAAACAATLHQITGNGDDARSLLAAAVRAYPQSVRLSRQLLELLVQQGRRDEAHEVLNSLPAEVRAAIDPPALRLDQPQSLRVIAPPTGKAADRQSLGR